MKKHNPILTLALLGPALVSCLDLSPESSISGDGVVSDIKAAEVILNGAYDAAGEFESHFLVAHNYASDNVVLYSGQAVVVPQFKAAGTSGFDPAAGGGYGDYYFGINEVNTLLRYVPGLSGNDSQKNRILGEAYFLRALAYFDLARTYGGVPLVLTPSESPSNGAGIRKSTYAETLAQVEADLNAAVAALDGIALTSRARASIWAVYALQARLYLYQERWAEAEQAASRVLASADFSLCPVLTDFFDNVPTAESIFSIVYSSADKSPFYTYYLASDKGGRLDYIPTPAFVLELLDPARGGARSGLVADKGDGVYVIREYALQDGSSPIQVLRLAEQYLIRAEARLRKATPDVDGALADLNAIRARAALAPLAADTPANLLLAVEQERRYELAFEAHRFCDIVRTGRAGEVFGAYDPVFANPNYWVLPFPANAILADPDLKQNPGY